MSKLARGKWYLFRDLGIFYLTCTKGYNADASYILESPEGATREYPQKMMDERNPIELPISDKGQLMFLDGLLRELMTLHDRCITHGSHLFQASFTAEDLRTTVQLLVHKVHTHCTTLKTFENEERMSPVLKPGGSNA